VLASQVKHYVHNRVVVSYYHFKNKYISGSSSGVERLLPKQKVVGSNPISRSTDIGGGYFVPASLSDSIQLAKAKLKPTAFSLLHKLHTDPSFAKLA
jgi:hypothetical protein